MTRLSRRQVATFAASQLIAGKAARPLARQLAAFLVVNRREGEAEQLVADIALAVQHQAGQAHAVVTTARPADSQLLKIVAEALKKELDVKTIELETQVDESVIGGVRIETADTTYDGTVRRKLARLRTGS